MGFFVLPYLNNPHYSGPLQWARGDVGLKPSAAVRLLRVARGGCGAESPSACHAPIFHPLVVGPLRVGARQLLLQPRAPEEKNPGLRIVSFLVYFPLILRLYIPIFQGCA